jgi:predicted dithiol-disulfide oxidoreductase (DUF899 family)
MSASTIEIPKIVSENEWLTARRELLRKEKDFTRLRDELTAQRRELPWVKVGKRYEFEGSLGRQTLPDLFDGQSQLVIYHFMFDPDWDAGCKSCCFWADNFNPLVVHLKHRDTTMMAISRAPYEKIAAYKKRMGWTFNWVSSYGSDFNFDYHVSFTPEELAKKEGLYNFVTQNPQSPELPGVSVFYRDPAGTVFHTYSAYSRGIDLLNTAYNYLDITPKGRDEGGHGMRWLRRHDEYTD